MIYLKWLLMLPVMLVVTAITFPLAFILPFFAQYTYGLLDNGTKEGMGWRLPVWLSWWQTSDNDLSGDEGWRTQHAQWRFKFPAPIATYIGRIGWLWRNPGYGYGCVMMTGNPITATFTGNDKVNDSPCVEGHCIVHSQGLFELVWVKRIGATKCIYVVLGWNIKGLIGSNQTTHKASYAFSPRISTAK